MKAVPAHAALLVVTLGAAWAVWARAGRAPAPPGAVDLWEADSTRVSAVRYEARGKRVEIERRSDSLGAYLWGRVTPANAPDTARPAEFLVGEPGGDLVRELSRPQALRDLGVVEADREREYGVAADSAGRLRVDVDGESHELRVGASVFGTGDRYVQDPASRRLYVLPGNVLVSLDAAESTLPERRLHAFTRDAIGSVVLRAAGGQRPMKRIASPGGPDAWAPPNTPDRPDQTFANFMDRLAQLSVDRYAPDVAVAGLQELARVEYRDERDGPLGWVALLRAPGQNGEYFVNSEHTRVAVRVFAGIAESLARDVDQFFGRSSVNPAG